MTDNRGHDEKLLALPRQPRRAGADRYSPSAIVGDKFRVAMRQIMGASDSRRKSSDYSDRLLAFSTMTAGPAVQPKERQEYDQGCALVEVPGLC